MQASPQAPPPPAGGSSASPVVVIDTSVWISRLLPGDANHLSARMWIEQHLVNGGLLVAPALLVTEVAAAISRQTGRPQLAHRAANRLYSMASMSLVAMDQNLVDAATNFAADLGIRGADALFMALARQLNIPLVSFDAEQLQRPASAIQTIRP